VVAVLYSITRPFSVGGFYAAMVQITGPELLDAAAAIEATSLNVAVVFGPALAGVLIGVFGVTQTVEVQAAITLLVAGLIVLNPAFGARGRERSASVLQAVSTGTRTLLHGVELRSSVIGSALSSAGWGVMIVGFPLYCTQILGAQSHDSGYLWAALGVGSIIGTFAVTLRPSLVLSAASYAVLALSALLWPLAHALVLGVAVVGLSGALEGPAFSGSIALRQRNVPPPVRAQVTTTVVGAIGIVMAAAAAVGGVIADPVALTYVFVALNLAAAAVALAGVRGAARQGSTA
jgi:hypothetical protein